LTDTKVAAYVAKYATKAAECTGTLDRRVIPSDRLAALPIREHARRLIAECLRLSKLPGLEELRLAAWAHMLGFRGHYADCRIMRTGRKGRWWWGWGPGLGLHNRQRSSRNVRSWSPGW
jgi:Replication initiator protein, pSAM2